MNMVANTALNSWTGESIDLNIRIQNKSIKAKQNKASENGMR